MRGRLLVTLMFLLAPILKGDRVPELVRDIASGLPVDSSPRHFASDGRTAYFFARDENGVELWKTDGTPEGTRMVSDIGPTGSSAYTSWEHQPDIVVSGDYIYFWAAELSYLDLWRSDGSPSGTINLTKALPDIFRLPSPTGRRTGRAVPFGSHGAVFTVPNNEILFVTNGTSESTYRIDDAPPFVEEETLTTLGDVVYFMRGKDLWRTDATGAGTQRVAEVGTVEQMVTVDRTLFFVRSPHSFEYELWRSDGTASGTKRIALFETGAGVVYGPPSLASIGATTYAVIPTFSSQGNSNVYVGSTEIWRSDGTESGTSRVIRVTGGFDSILAKTDQLLFFSVDVDDEERMVWCSDGTDAGTRPLGSVEGWPLTAVSTRDRLFLRVEWGDDRGVWVADGTPGKLEKMTTSIRHDASFAALGEIIVMSATDAIHGDELWISDGTRSGTRMLQNIAADGGSNGSVPRRFGRDSILFPALTGEYGWEPWISDGTFSGTRLVADIEPGSRGSYPHSFSDLGNGRAIFVADEAVHGHELWATDGSEAGTGIVRDLTPGKYGSNFSTTLFPVFETAAGKRALFFALSGTDPLDLWSTDGTDTGTRFVKSQIEPLYQSNAIVFNGAAYISAPSGLWKSDGTADGTTLINRNGHAIGTAGAKLFYTAGRSTSGRELWFTDGTDAGTRFVQSIDAYGPFVGRTWSVDVNGVLFFGMADDVHGVEPWRSDGTEEGTFMLKDIATGFASSHVAIEERENAVAYRGQAYFLADDGVHGAELWQSDGTAAGTKMVKDIAPGKAPSYPGPMDVLSGRLYFAANDFENGRELWSSDGTSTEMEFDLNPGSASSAPRDFIRLGSSLLFFATHANMGRELWKIEAPRREGPGTRTPDRP